MTTGQIIKNTKEVKGFAANTFLSPGDLTKDYFDLLQKLGQQKYETAQELEAALAELDAVISPNTKAKLAAVGARLPTDAVLLTVELGHFLYEALEQATPVPEAPLNRAAHVRRMQKVAERLEAETFCLTESELAVVKGHMQNEAAWSKDSKYQYSTYTELTKDGVTTKKVLTLTAEGMAYFTATVNAAVALFETADGE